MQLKPTAQHDPFLLGTCYPVYVIIPVMSVSSKVVVIFFNMMQC